MHSGILDRAPRAAYSLPMQKREIDIGAGYLLLPAPTALEIKAAVKDFTRLFGRKPRIHVKGFFGVKAMRDGGVHADLRRTADPDALGFPVPFVGTTWILIKVDGEEVSVNPRHGSEVIIKLSLSPEDRFYPSIA